MKNMYAMRCYARNILLFTIITSLVILFKSNSDIKDFCKLFVAGILKINLRAY